VQAALTAFQPHFAPDGDGQPSTLELVAFEVAMQEVKDAREAFDILMCRTSGKNPKWTHL
jgi:hypothetical protein